MNVDLPDKLYYSIGEVAKAFDVNASLIRFWEKEFEIIQPKKNAKGNRLFTKDDIQCFKNIYYLVKIKGYTLDGAKQAIGKKGVVKTKDEIDVVKRLENIKDELIKLKMSFESEEILEKDELN
ncbi:MerR family transcriptional regulator [Empedobacter stercoris]|uniref:MerR family transcriptional regulator n=2 Tax=Empedobacter TaxID=59734 RepID=A0ABY8VAL0_9FLAO|nr:MULTISPECIES: MerR family transcriptional regulator [Empedobacter]MCA4775547.1 MerR family transcriptional regulator [Empedobacter stercoris]MCA4781673.1 MerR family transcriptional regulator [Empedobacter stercoris]MCA4808443.1 MerR family transcriptional regulator [Empedobacter stercoris]MDM1524030.1 MerR family transcriptional regulator [Empedobacter sp. 225-1]MDM1543973.1 MerR family transcriptional regulator [Empedobacter sp. 189-2]